MEKIIEKLKEFINDYGDTTYVVYNLPLTIQQARKILTALEGPSEEEMKGMANEMGTDAENYAAYHGALWAKNWKGGEK